MDTSDFITSRRFFDGIVVVLTVGGVPRSAGFLFQWKIRFLLIKHWASGGPIRERKRVTMTVFYDFGDHGSVIRTFFFARRAVDTDVDAVFPMGVIVFDKSGGGGSTVLTLPRHFWRLSAIGSKSVSVGSSSVELGYFRPLGNASTFDRLYWSFGVIFSRWVAGYYSDGEVIVGGCYIRELFPLR